MGKLVLVRHSEPEIRADIPASEWDLSPTGRQLAQELANVLRVFVPEEISCSKEPKAVETAVIIGNALGVPVRIREDLEEHHRDGVPHFSTRRAFEKAVMQIMICPDRLIMGSETGRRALDRFGDAISDRLRSQSGDVIVVTHGTVMALYCGETLGVDPTEVWRRLTMPCFTVLKRTERPSLGPGIGGRARPQGIRCVPFANVEIEGPAGGLTIYRADENSL